MERVVRIGALLAVLAAGGALYLLLVAGGGASGKAPALPLPQPIINGATQISTSETPPTQAQCFIAGRRCFDPQGITTAYNLAPLYAQNLDGRGETIAIVDSYGSDTIAHDLHVFDNAYGVQSMCGEEGVTCTAGMPKFSQLALQGNPATVSHASPNSHSPGQENKTAWSLEVSLDVERAHAVAPGANILLVTTPTAETLGVQGFPQMMAAEDYVVKHHLANVISQSFGAAEQSFGSTKSLLNLRNAFEDAAQNGVTVLASAGDGGSANALKAPVGQGGSSIPFPTVIWPASDPLVTSVGGTFLCTSPSATSRLVDNADPPAACKSASAAGQAETVWNQGNAATGGGFSSVFAEPSYQAATLPTGSKRGVPDIGLNAAPGTGVTIYDTLPPAGSGGLSCGPSGPCSTGWYAIGGTSASAPQWAGIVAIADQSNGAGLGLINPALYKVASDPSMYANDFFDVTVGDNKVDPTIDGFTASTGWDPTTGLGTPNAANLVPDLIAASH